MPGFIGGVWADPCLGFGRRLADFGGYTVRQVAGIQATAGCTVVRHGRTQQVALGARFAATRGRRAAGAQARD